jgi:hypothetical protein
MKTTSLSKDYKLIRSFSGIPTKKTLEKYVDLEKDNVTLEISWEPEWCVFANLTFKNKDGVFCCISERTTDDSENKCTILGKKKAYLRFLKSKTVIDYME